MLGKKLLDGDKRFAEAWNFAPHSSSAITVKEVVELVIKYWGGGKWVSSRKDEKIHETNVLNLDATKAKTLLGWRPKFGIKEAVKNC